MSSRFAIVNPCPKRWADLQGDGRTRYCDDCRTSVHPIEHCSAEELDRVWRKSDGHVCGCLAGESPPERRSRRAVLVGALLTAISPLMAQTGRVRVRVTDKMGAVIPGAEVSVLGPDGKPTQTVTSNDAGEALLVDLPIGDCRLVAVAPGFAQRRLRVTLQGENEVKIDAVLDVAVLTGVLVEVAPPRPKRRRWLIFG